MSTIYNSLSGAIPDKSVQGRRVLRVPPSVASEGPTDLKSALEME